uniref:Rab-GAP TBC domain-containing protein n=2 Tax=Lotharella globosa TaxID=91324 RepID=A0A7S4DS92_9EUKA
MSKPPAVEHQQSDPLPLKTKQARIARLGSSEYNSMTRSVESLGELQKFKIDPERQISMIEDVKGNNWQEVRKGIIDYRRPNVWRKMLKLDPEEDYEAKFMQVVDSTFFKEVPQHVTAEVEVPDFGGALLFNSHGITENVQESAAMVLCILQAEHVNVTYCPILPDMVAILVKYLRPSEAFYAVSKMLEDEALPVNGREYMVMTLTCKELIKRHNRAFYDHAKKLGMQFNDIIGVWIARLFTSFLPYTCVLRIMDCVLAEGLPVLHRIVVAVTKMYTKDILACRTGNDLEATLAKLMRTQTNAGVLIEEAFKTKIAKHFIQSLDLQHNIDHVPFHKVQVFSVPHFNSERPSKLASTADLRRIWMWLPNLLRIEDPVVLFSSDKDGYNFDNMLDLIRQKQANKEPIFVLVKSKDMPVVGFFLDWSYKKGYLDENAFVFRLGSHAKSFMVNSIKSGGKCYKRLRTFIVQRATDHALHEEQARERLLQTGQVEDVPPNTPADPVPLSPSSRNEIPRITSSKFSISFASKNKTSQNERKAQRNYSKFLNDYAHNEDPIGEETKKEIQSAYCKSSARKYMREALSAPEMKTFFDNLDEDSTGTLDKEKAFKFFRKFFTLVFQGSHVEEDMLARILRVGPHRLWAIHSKGSPPTVSWKDLNKPCDQDDKTVNVVEKRHDNGAWVFVDQYQGLGVGVGDDIALHFHPGLKTASTNKTAVSPSLAPHSKDGSFPVFGLEIWGFTNA